MKKETGLANILVLVVVAAFIAMSAVMIFIPGVQIEYLCYGACVAVVIMGIFMIVRYFMTDAYKNMNAYGFSIGTFLIILAICGFLKAEAMASAFVSILGIILLLSGIIVLQHSLDLHRMKDGVWAPSLFLALIILICSMVVILQPMADKLGYDAYVWWMILIASALSFIINIYTMIKVAMFKKKENKQEQQAETEGKTEDRKQTETGKKSENEKQTGGDTSIGDMDVDSPPTSESVTSDMGKEDVANPGEKAKP